MGFKVFNVMSSLVSLKLVLRETDSITPLTEKIIISVTVTLNMVFEILLCLTDFATNFTSVFLFRMLDSHMFGKQRKPYVFRAENAGQFILQLSLLFESLLPEL